MRRIHVQYKLSTLQEAQEDKVPKQPLHLPQSSLRSFTSIATQPPLYQHSHHRTKTATTMPYQHSRHHTLAPPKAATTAITPHRPSHKPHLALLYMDKERVYTAQWTACGRNTSVGSYIAVYVWSDCMLYIMHPYVSFFFRGHYPQYRLYCLHVERLVILDSILHLYLYSWVLGYAQSTYVGCVLN